MPDNNQYRIYNTESAFIGVVLTGTLGDGASGLWSVAQSGGVTVVQDPKDAAFAEMPLNALERVEPRYIAPLSGMPELLQKLVCEPASDPVRPPGRTAIEVNIARGGRMPIDEMDRIGRRSVFACPECHGVMWEIDEGNLTRFRCHVGHAYTAELMSLALEDNLRRALGTALRSLEERVTLTQNLQRQAEALQHTQAAATWSARAAEVRKELDVIEGAVQRMDEIAAMVARRRDQG